MHKTLSVLLMLASAATWAQTGTHKYNIDWQITPAAITFDGETGINDTLDIPFALHLIDCGEAFVELDTCNSVEAPQAFADTVLQLLPDGWRCFDSRIVCIRKKNLNHICVYPFFKDGSGRWRLASGYSLTTWGTAGVSPDAGPRPKDALSSVLAGGTWVKVRVESTGVKRIGYSTLASWGFADPTRVAVYGNGGKQLAYANSSTRPVDIAKLPVHHANNAIYFYARGTESWSYSKSSDFFSCTTHLYDTYAYYYITESDEPSAEPELIEAYKAGKVSEVYTDYDYYEHHEVNTTNIAGSGRELYGESFGSSTPRRTISFGLTGLEGETTAKIKAKVAATGSGMSNIAFAHNGSQLTSSDIAANSSDEAARSVTTSIVQFGTTSSRLDIDISYTPPSATSTAWLDYLTINAQVPLKMGSAKQLQFRKGDSFSGTDMVRFCISGATASTRVWKVGSCTAPVEMAGEITDGVFRFNAKCGSDNEFVAFDDNAQLEEPTFVGTVANQDLHAMPAVNYLIIAHPDFLTQAQELAELHRSAGRLSTAVATTEQIYNEYSSGTRDASAIRDFIRSIYLKADDGDADALKYVLLFGDGHYNNLAYGSTNPTNKIPTYESAQSLYLSSTYCTDDFYGFLDYYEGSSDLSARMDVAVGRMPVSTTEQADIVVQKSRNYMNSKAPGKWKKKAVFLADDGDTNEHVNYAELNAARVAKEHSDMDVERIYLDGYTVTTGATGKTYPQANTDLETAIANGIVLLNYVGHGSPRALSAELVVTLQSVRRWTNADKLFFFITATCEFAPFDAGNTSAGEYALLNANGGCISILSTTRLVYGDRSYQFNSNIFNKLFSADTLGHAYTYGDALLDAKIKAGGSSNTLKYVYLGDPALAPPLNTYTIVTDSINGEAYDESTEPIAPLRINSIVGSVRDADGNVATDFDGQIDLSLFDKERTVNTLGNEGPAFSYTAYADKLYTGTVDVSGGRFGMELLLSKNSSYETSYGKLLYFGTASDGREASGADAQVLVGGVPQTIDNDTVGPDICAWINFENFVNGQTVGNTPRLHIDLSDPSGINTAGAGVGHDIALIINGNRASATVLNSLYAGDSSFRSGSIDYNFGTLDDGRYEVEIKAWDNMNNSSSKTLTFYVRADASISFENVRIYPNPFGASAGKLTLSFEHSAPGEVLNLDIRLFSLGGGLMIRNYITTIASQNSVTPIDLMSVDSRFAALPHGVYLLQVRVDNGNGRSGEINKKIVVAGQ